MGFDRPAEYRIDLSMENGRSELGARASQGDGRVYMKALWKLVE
jgi:hypothetical protein